MGFTMQLFTNFGGGIAKSRQGLRLYITFKKKFSIGHRSSMTEKKPKQEIQVCDACREAEHSSRHLASCPPQSVGIPSSQSETAICYCDQISPHRKHGWQKGVRDQLKISKHSVNREPSLGMKALSILSFSTLLFSPHIVIGVLYTSVTVL